MRQLKEALAADAQFTSQDKLMLWSAFTLAFFGFLRSSEFTSPSTSYFDSLVHLSHSDIRFTTQGSLIMQLKSSKTDPFRKGCSITLSLWPVGMCRTGHAPLPGSPAFLQCHPPLLLLSRAISHEGHSHLHLTPPAPTFRIRHRVLCFPQFLH